MTRKSTAATLLMAIVLVPGCLSVDEQDSTAFTYDDVVFDGAEIKAELAENPDAMFFVDARKWNFYHFDQTEEMIDFSNFTFQCPSMSTPIPMTIMLQYLNGVHFGEYWSLRRHDFTKASPSEKDSRCIVYCPADDDCIEACI